MDKSHKNLKSTKINTHLVHYKVKIQCISRASLNNIEHTTQLLCYKRTNGQNSHTACTWGSPQLLKRFVRG